MSEEERFTPVRGFIAKLVVQHDEKTSSQSGTYLAHKDWGYDDKDAVPTTFGALVERAHPSDIAARRNDTPGPRPTSSRRALVRVWQMWSRG